MTADPFGTQDGHYPERVRVLRPVPASALVTLAIGQAGPRGCPGARFDAALAAVAGEVTSWLSQQEMLAVP